MLQRLVEKRMLGGGTFYYWYSDQQLLAFLNLFLLEYNDRPHQGFPSPSLSPNEFAKRLSLM